MIEDLLVPSARSLHVHRCTFLMLFILMLYTSTYLPENKSVYFNAFLLGYPTTKTCFLTLLFLDMPIDSPINVSIALHVHRYSRLSVCLLSLSLPFLHNFMHNYLSTHLLGYIHTDLPENKPDYLHASLSSNHKDLPVTTNTCVYAYGCTRASPSLLIFILSFRLTVRIYPSTFLHLHRCTCSSVYLFSLFLLFRHNLHNDLSTHLVGYLHTGPPENKF